MKQRYNSDGTDMGRVSVIVPAWNAKETLREAVESLLKTGYSDLEIVIVEDGSSDSTFALALELKERNPNRVKLIQHKDKNNHGVSATRNLGIRSSTGEWIAFLDADDYVLPHRFERAASMLDTYPDIDAVVELARVEYENNVNEDNFWSASRLFGVTQHLSKDGLLDFLLEGRSWPTSAILFRRKLLEKTGLFDETLSYAEDCHLWLRLVIKGKVVQGSTSEPVSVYRRHGGNTFDAVPERKVDMLKALTSAYAWARQNCDSRRTRHRFKEGVKQFLLRSLVTHREQGRTDLARRAVAVVAKSAVFSTLFSVDIVRQITALYLDGVGRGGVDIRPSGS